MAQSSRTFRVFVSSTFGDLIEERNALQHEVFPRLRTLCHEHGRRFQPVDIRGQREKSSHGRDGLLISPGDALVLMSY